MGFSDLTEFITLIEKLPTSWQIIFAVSFFLLPRLIQILGGGKVVSGAITSLWNSLMGIVTRYQKRKQRQIEDESYDKYTRTLLIESLSLFSERLKRMDRKINHLVGLLDNGVDIEGIEITSLKRTKSDTLSHSRIDERLKKLRKDLDL